MSDNDLVFRGVNNFKKKKEREMREPDREEETGVRGTQDVRKGRNE